MEYIIVAVWLFASLVWCLGCILVWYITGKEDQRHARRLATYHFHG